LLKKMSESLIHRGPDGEGYYSDKKVSLGHRRLSIIDLESGGQPMYNADQSIVLIYNGEIYNFKELRQELESKYTFQTQSDTEVIIHAYQEYGFDCLNKFNGMFAFALWDKNKQQLFLARDRVGIKPLYYYYDGRLNRFWFASEIKSILQDKSIFPEINPESLVDYLAFQNILDEKTFFKGIKQLLPGHYMVVDTQGLKLHQYWDSSYLKKSVPKNSSIQFYRHQFAKIFKDSVRGHLISDVPLGTYLSGGFDSGSVTMLASKLIPHHLQTFTGTFRETGKYLETPCSRAVAKTAGAEINEIVITPRHFLQNINKVIYHLDEPKVGVPAISQYMVSELVSKKVKVILTGHAGDELFAGYPIYKAFYFKDLLRKNPLNIFRLFTFFKLSEIPRSAYFLLFPWFDKEVRPGLFIIFNQNQRKRLFTSNFYQRIKSYQPVKTVELYLQGKNISNADRAQYLYFKTYLPSLLILEDKMGMAHSIEARTPLCDNKLVEFAHSIPWEYKLYGGELKHLIKHTMRGLLPDILYQQPKKGFPTPFSLWIRGELKDYIYETLLDKRTWDRGIFNQKYVKKLLDRHCNSKSDTLLDQVNAARIWSLLNVELWFRIFIDGDEVMGR